MNVSIKYLFCICALGDLIVLRRNKLYQLHRLTKRKGQQNLEMVGNTANKRHLENVEGVDQNREGRKEFVKRKGEDIFNKEGGIYFKLGEGEI